MDDIIRSISHVHDIMDEIASASDEQSRGINQISTAVAEMDATTQQNAALVEESSAAANSLEEQSVALAQAVSVFRLGNEGATAPHNRVAATAARKPLMLATSAPQRQTAHHRRPGATRSKDDWEAF
ncbi:Methyl-accepting chemotaxis protein I (serine chemoreceptor protein) [Dickeya aquatica]|uniref:Methyl-accepting chemotaxis protein I (Serine chemoreceptor protein) n=1 Tax=Dickeya aquatica TaxID=1401087 RepID=A0A375ACH1_9GAMM|nr:Methyl-accepting chemotaxis protein I (serine chemoreceptor protein) [Dickeya aquatica]